ncbi:hypothetical protein GPECTOR_20g417 [Gonium pectorale]|uniref:Uncharacterized protein n=1 Tax=Gonium pectorale TaxID=33097 RepID=A0A150GIB1_GONPE|nr:hypothetical protein GPECTOR_20g417 [Gonium pectorale]|eukprot:KXZ49562.1 hypothetical protein GPECTOR_20g417 [Gonium pectorale]
METEEGPGYADVDARRSDPWDIPRPRDRGAAVAAASAGPSYGGGDVMQPDEMPAYGYRVGDETQGLPRSGLGATGAFGGGEAAAAAVGSWPSHGLGDGFVSGGRHVLYCGADIPMEQLERGHWHHAARPRGCSPLQAVAGSPSGQHQPGGNLLLRHTSEPGGSHGSAAPSHMWETHESLGTRGHAYRVSSGGGGHGGGGGFGDRDRRGQAAPHTAAASGGGDMVEDDVVEVEADTPGGYHVAATVLHPADSDDPQEFVVAATAVMSP